MFSELPVFRYLMVCLFLQSMIAALPHDAHPMSALVTSISALGSFHPDANPALKVRLFFLSVLPSFNPFHLQHRSFV